MSGLMQRTRCCFLSCSLPDSSQDGKSSLSLETKHHRENAPKMSQELLNYPIHCGILLPGGLPSNTEDPQDVRRHLENSAGGWRRAGLCPTPVQWGFSLPLRCTHGKQAPAVCWGAHPSQGTKPTRVTPTDALKAKIFYHLIPPSSWLTFCPALLTQ